MKPLLVEKIGPQSFQLFGEIDLARASELDKVLSKEAELGGDIRLDLTEVEFMDSVAIGVFARVARALEENGRLILVSPTGPVRLALETMRLDIRENIEVVD